MSYRVAALVEAQWPVLRAIRMQALADSPTAFGSTLAREQAFTEATWRERARGSETSRLFLAWEGEAAVGIAGIIDEDDGSAEVVSVWVSPAHRGRGVARSLTLAALRFAAERHFTTIRLWVTAGNEAARTMYEGLGFSPTGRRQPLPSDPGLEEHQLELSSPPSAAAPAHETANHPLG